MSRLRIYFDFVLILFVSVCFPFAEVGDGTTIAGLDEGIRGMREGGYRRFLIPPQIAYQEGAASAVVTVVTIAAIVIHSKVLHRPVDDFRSAGQELQPLPERDDLKRNQALTISTSQG